MNRQKPSKFDDDGDALIDFDACESGDPVISAYNESAIEENHNDIVMRSVTYYENYVHDKTECSRFGKARETRSSVPENIPEFVRVKRCAHSNRFSIKSKMDESEAKSCCASHLPYTIQSTKCGLTVEGSDRKDALDKYYENLHRIFGLATDSSHIGYPTEFPPDEFPEYKTAWNDSNFR